MSSIIHEMIRILQKLEKFPDESTPENISRAWEGLSATEIVEALDDPRVTVHPIGVFDAKLIQIGGIGLVVMERLGFSMGNYDIVVGYDGAYSRKLTIACACCKPYLWRGGEELSYPNDEAFGAFYHEDLITTKKEKGVVELFMQSGGVKFPEWIKDLSTPLPIPREVPIFWCQDNILYHISESPPKTRRLFK